MNFSERAARGQALPRRVALILSAWFMDGSSRSGCGRKYGRYGAVEHKRLGTIGAVTVAKERL